jgi:hypothetical protein
MDKTFQDRANSAAKSTARTADPPVQRQGAWKPIVLSQLYQSLPANLLSGFAQAPPAHPATDKSPW